MSKKITWYLVLVACYWLEINIEYGSGRIFNYQIINHKLVSGNL